MALIKKREHSLRTILLSYVVSLTVLSAISSLLILSLFSLSYRFGVVFPANQVESDLSAQELYVENQLLDLTRSEYRICQFLAENKGQVFSKEQIYTHLYGYEDKGSPTAVAEHIKNIRAKLKDVGQNPIETVWGIGYKWH